MIRMLTVRWFARKRIGKVLDDCGLDKMCDLDDLGIDKVCNGMNQYT